MAIGRNRITQFVSWPKAVRVKKLKKKAMKRTMVEQRVANVLLIFVGHRFQLFIGKHGSVFAYIRAANIATSAFT